MGLAKPDLFAPLHLLHSLCSAIDLWGEREREREKREERDGEGTERTNNIKDIGGIEADGSVWY
jgi:hypothetical protein